MVELSNITQSWYILNVMLCVFFVLQVSYAESYRPLQELNNYPLLNSALEDSYLTDDTQPADDMFDNIKDDSLPTDKRYARLSYSYSKPSRGRNYYNSRYYRSRYYANYYKPWLNLVDKECFRDKCRFDRDCCRRYSKCDKSAKICYNCWYGHPCKTSRDCCEQYSYCNRHLGICQG